MEYYKVNGNQKTQKNIYLKIDFINDPVLISTKFNEYFMNIPVIQ